MATAPRTTPPSLTDRKEILDLKENGWQTHCKLKNSFCECNFITMSRPSPESCAPFYQHYIGLAQGEQATALPGRYGKEIADFFSTLPQEKATYSYARGKWTLLQVLQHLVDVERVFVYRLLWIVRGDRQPLAGFDENSFAEKGSASLRTLQDLTKEFLLLRGSTDLFVAQLSAAELEESGVANGSMISANALCFIIYGHVIHHMNIIAERYL